MASAKLTDHLTLAETALLARLLREAQANGREERTCYGLLQKLMRAGAEIGPALPEVR